jgi:hypothetical protein
MAITKEEVVEYISNLSVLDCEEAKPPRLTV